MREGALKEDDGREVLNAPEEALLEDEGLDGSLVKNEGRVGALEKDEGVTLGTGAPNKDKGEEGVS